jgi:hypothetical protein
VGLEYLFEERRSTATNMSPHDDSLSPVYQTVPDPAKKFIFNTISLELMKQPFVWNLVKRFCKFQKYKVYPSFIQGEFEILAFLKRL